MLETVLGNPIAQNALGGIIAAIVMAAVPVLWEHASKRQRRSHITTEETFTEIKNRQYRNPWSTLILVLAFIQIAWNLLIPVADAVDHYAYRSLPSNYEILGNIITLTVFFGGIAVALLCGSIFIAHRLKIRPILWSISLVLGTLIFMMGELTVRNGQPTPEDIWILLGIFAVVQIPMAYLGCYIARKTQRSFVMRQLFKRLPDKDQQALIELIDTLPSLTDANQSRQ